MYKIVKIQEETDIIKFISYVGEDYIRSYLFPYIEIKQEKIFELCLLNIITKIGSVYVLNSKVEEYYEK